MMIIFVCKHVERATMINTQTRWEISSFFNAFSEEKNFNHKAYTICKLQAYLRMRTLALTGMRNSDYACNLNFGMNKWRKEHSC